MDILVEMSGVQCQFECFVSFDSDHNWQGKLVVSVGMKIDYVSSSGQTVDLSLNVGLYCKGDSTASLVGGGKTFNEFSAHSMVISTASTVNESGGAKRNFV